MASEHPPASLAALQTHSRWARRSPVINGRLRWVIWISTARPLPPVPRTACFKSPRHTPRPPPLRPHSFRPSDSLLDVLFVLYVRVVIARESPSPPYCNRRPVTVTLSRDDDVRINKIRSCLSSGVSFFFFFSNTSVYHQNTFCTFDKWNRIFRATEIINITILFTW